MEEEVTQSAEVVEALDHEEVEALEVDEEVQESTPEDPAESEPPKPKKGVQKRIDELTREKYEEREKRERIEAEYQATQRELEQMRQTQLAQRLQTDAPKLADFGYDEEAYSRAYGEWYQGELSKYQRAKEQEAQRMSALQKQAEFNAKVNTKIVEGQAKYEDFNAVINSPQAPPLRSNPAVFQEVMNSESASDLLYYMGKNLSETLRILQLPESAARREVFKLEAKLNQPIQSTVTSAPEPPKKVKAGGKAALDPSKMTTEEWIEWRNNGGG